MEEVENPHATQQATTGARGETRRLVDINRRALSLSRDLLTSRGEITVLDVLDRERALTDARLQQARSQRDVAVDYIILHTVLGQGHELATE